MIDRLITKVRSKQVCVGVLEVLGSPQVCETMAASGLDYVCIDQMFSSIDWNLTAHMVRACKAAGISPMDRPVPSAMALPNASPNPVPCVRVARSRAASSASRKPRSASGSPARRSVWCTGV